VGLFLAAAAVMAVIGFSTLDVQQAQIVEQAMSAAG
jgi:hypothetical protein